RIQIERPDTPTEWRGRAPSVMPIRFRCPHCHQLLGIARRKSGSMVHCPTCNASVLVPDTDEASDEPSPPMVPLPAPAPVAAPEAHVPTSPPPPSVPAQGFFDRDDFDALLKFSVSGPVEPRKSAAGSVVHTPVPPTRNPAPEAPPAPVLPPPPPAANIDPLQAL